MKITCLGGINEIGGNKILVEDNGTRIFLDFGRAMALASLYYEEFIKVRSKSALLDLLKLGVLPKVDGLYPKHLLDITAIPSEGVNITSKLPWDEAKDYWKNDSIQPYGSVNKIDAVFLSHAHFDHIQDISFIHKDIKIYSTETTKILAKAITDISQSSVEHQFYEVDDKIKIKTKSESYKTVFPGELEFQDVKETTLIDDPKTRCTFTHEINTVQRNYITDSKGEVRGLRYKLIPVGHSVDGSCSILITTKDDKSILYTGDIRFHGTKEPTFEEYIKNIGENKINIMICEGTRIDSNKEITEEDVYRNIKDEVKQVKGLILVDFGWKDTTRFNTFVRVANDIGRTFVINVKLAYLLYELHCTDSKKFPDPRTMKNVKVYKKRQGDLLYSKVDYDKFKAGYLCHWGRNIAKNDQNIVRISEKMGIGGECSSQTENPTDIEKNAWDLAINHIENGIPAYKIREKPEKYILMFSFWDANELFDLSNQNGTIPNSKYIRASCQPFNDEMEIDEERLMNWLDKFGVNYVVDDENEKKFFKRAHVSGHLCKPELKRLIETIKPEILMPVHTKKPEIFEELSKGISKVIIPKYNETYTF